MSAAVGDGELSESMAGGWGRRVALLLWASLSLFPLVVMVGGSFLPGAVLDGREGLAEASFSWEHYRELLGDGRLLGWTLQSLIVAATCAAGQVLSAASLAYVLAKHRFAGRHGVLILVGLLMMVPGQVIVVPLFVLVTQLGLVDSLAGVIAPALVTPFGIFLMYTRMVDVPDELIEAARIDGCGELTLFARVVLPLVAPAAATLGIFAFVGQWNAFLWPLLVLFGTDRYTLPVGLATLQGQHQIGYGILLAGATIAALPMVFVFLLFQRAFTRGLTSGAVKG